MLTIRPQNKAADLDAICRINDAAFAEHGGTVAFDRLREERDDIVSLVAEQDGELVGHVLFSPVILDAPVGRVSGMGLGQLAVTPARQKQGIGSQLSEAGIAQLRERGCPFIIVVGHAAYYPRFGFEQGSQHGFRCQWEGVPDETFMVLMLETDEPDKLRGVASFDGI